MLEFKQVTLNCVRDKNVLCYFVARNEAKVSIVSFFIEFDIHWELNVVQIKNIVVEDCEYNNKTMGRFLFMRYYLNLRLETFRKD